MEKREEEGVNVVFILNDMETQEINGSLISYCKTFNLHHYILPKFVKNGFCDLFKVKKLTCFSLFFNMKAEEREICEVLLSKLKEFDNLKLEENLSKGSLLSNYKNAEAQLFKSCLVKKWEVVINPRKKRLKQRRLEQ